MTSRSAFGLFRVPESLEIECARAGTPCKDITLLGNLTAPSGQQPQDAELPVPAHCRLIFNHPLTSRTPNPAELTLDIQ
jgi:hypothetical protein